MQKRKLGTSNLEVSALGLGWAMRSESVLRTFGFANVPFNGHLKLTASDSARRGGLR
jgi:aryl-alcohol dehydrogenase-like predicted oxidoreductase